MKWLMMLFDGRCCFFFFWRPAQSKVKFAEGSGERLRTMTLAVARLESLSLDRRGQGRDYVPWLCCRQFGESLPWPDGSGERFFPTQDPTPDPTPGPTPVPTQEPTPDPTPGPTPDLTPDPTPDPTPAPKGPTPDPTKGPTPDPTLDPTKGPTPDPTPEPRRCRAPVCSLSPDPSGQGTHSKLARQFRESLESLFPDRRGQGTDSQNRRAPV